MAAYNAAGFIEQAVASVLAQTLTDLELIVIDDGSTDATGRILARLAALDPRVRTASQDNQGVGAATNHALRLARAHLIAILDSDDTMAPERLRTQAHYLDTHPEVCAVGSQWFEMDEAGRITGIDRHALDPEDTRRRMFDFFSAHHPTIMARRAAIETAGGYPDSPDALAPDYEVFARLVLAGNQICNLPQALTSWRLSPHGITHGRAAQQTLHSDAIRHRAFAALQAADPAQADATALALVRAHPAGSWFDDKLARLVAAPRPSPALTHWRRLAVRGGVPALEAAAVEWLRDEPGHGRTLAAELDRAGFDWLARLVLAHGAHIPPMEAAPNAPSIADPGPPGTTAGEPGPVTLSVLVPTHTDDKTLATRLTTLLPNLPASSEVLVFTIDGQVTSGPHPRLPDDALALDRRVRLLPLVPVPQAWCAALGSVRGAQVAWLESDATHHPDWLAAAISGQGNPSAANTVLVSPAIIHYRDALSATGEPLCDPGLEPRWTRQTLLGRDHLHLSALVVPRTALDALPLQLEELGSEAGWAIARALVSTHPVTCLDVRGQVVRPEVGLHNRILPTLVQRLVAWYLDSGFASIPAPWAWPRLGRRAVQDRLATFDAHLTAERCCIHPGNLVITLRFLTECAPQPLLDPSFRRILDAHPRAGLTALRRADRPATALTAAGLYAARRLMARFRRRPPALP